MKLIMTLTANNENMKVYANNRKDFTNPVEVKTQKETITFNNIKEFWAYIQPMRVNNIQQVK